MGASSRHGGAAVEAQLGHGGFQIWMGAAASMESQRWMAELGRPATDDGTAGNPNHRGPSRGRGEREERMARYRITDGVHPCETVLEVFFSPGLRASPTARRVLALNHDHFGPFGSRSGHFKGIDLPP
jgi:hypothetical protein